MSLETTVKEILGAKEINIPVEQDKLFNLEVQSVFDYVKHYTGNDFSEYTEIPFAIANYIASVIEYKERPDVKGNLKSRSMGTVSYSYKDVEGIYPSHLLSLLEPYMIRKKARFHVLR